MELLPTLEPKRVSMEALPLLLGLIDILPTIVPPAFLLVGQNLIGLS